MVLQERVPGTSNLSRFEKSRNSDLTTLASKTASIGKSPSVGWTMRGFENESRDNLRANLSPPGKPMPSDVAGDMVNKIGNSDSSESAEASSRFNGEPLTEMRDSGPDVLGLIEFETITENFAKSFGL